MILHALYGKNLTEQGVFGAFCIPSPAEDADGIEHKFIRKAVSGVSASVVDNVLILKASEISIAFKKAGPVIENHYLKQIAVFINRTTWRNLSTTRLQIGNFDYNSGNPYPAHQTIRLIAPI